MINSIIRILCIILLTLWRVNDRGFRYTEVEVSCVHFTEKSHSVTRCFLWQGAFYVQGALGNAQHLNPLVFQKAFRCPTFLITVTVTDFISRSFQFPIQLVYFTWVLSDCSTIQFLNITFTFNGTLLPRYNRTWKICVTKGLWDFLILKGLLKVYFGILFLRNLIILLW